MPYGSMGFALCSLTTLTTRPKSPHREMCARARTSTRVHDNCSKSVCVQTMKHLLLLLHRHCFPSLAATNLSNLMKALAMMNRAPTCSMIRLAGTIGFSVSIRVASCGSTLTEGIRAYLLRWAQMVSCDFTAFVWLNGLKPGTF